MTSTEPWPHHVSNAVAQQASSMRACHLRPTRMKVEGTEESTIALFIEHASPCLGKLGRLQLCAPLLRRGNAVQPTFREGIGKVCVSFSSCVASCYCVNSMCNVWSESHSTQQVLLAHVPNLKTLEVGICVATADVVKSLAMISSLEYLSMTVEPEPLAAVTTLSSVRKLHLRVANQSYDVVVEDGLAALANLPNLTDLSLWDVQLGQDTAHALLSHAPRLTALEALLQPPTSSITVGPTLRLLTLIEPTLSTLRHILRSPQCVLVVDGPVSVDSGDTELLASISAADFRLFTELTLCTASGSLESAHLLPALAAGLSTGDCAIKVLVLDDFELEPLAVRDLMRVAPRLVSLKLV